MDDRNEAIETLVNSMLEMNLDDTAVNDFHAGHNIEILRERMSANDIAEAERQFSIEWASKTHFKSGEPIPIKPCS